MSVERQISVEQTRPTVVPEQREGDQFVERENVVVSVLVRDDESSTISKVRKNVEHEVKKWSDVVHAERSFGSSLYSMKTQNKSLTDIVIQYFQRCFGYALKQSKDDEEGVRNGLKSIVPHAYGDHSSCGNWCGYLKNSASYKHRGLPHGKDLMDKSLRQSLEKILEIYASNAKKLAPLGSNQVIEALNNTIGSKAPKSRHYGSSNDAEILQIAATNGKDEFSIYMKPCNVISTEASAVNKLTFQRGILFYDGKPITDAIATDVALKTFIEN
ncbi:uncharacterized protein LOC111344367 [Stylophora pistillata]|uniref:uncharacterized protein LOC111344367 n=1 Tax=Stylophora pistillata TaxID=50429 RepID=UPI000C050D8C|nr:uncharacterized protein LOC111344367 [Stylophora pistillata]